MDRYTHFARRFPHVLKMDVERFFPSIDHAILIRLLARRLPEPPVRALIASMLQRGRQACEPCSLHMPGDALLTPFSDDLELAPFPRSR